MGGVQGSGKIASLELSPRIARQIHKPFILPDLFESVNLWMSYGFNQPVSDKEAWPS